jgi:hypothetical protein
LPGATALRELLHRVLICDGIAFADRLVLEEIDVAAIRVSQRYASAPCAASVMRAAVIELRNLTLEARSTLAKYGYDCAHRISPGVLTEIPHLMAASV